MGFDKWNQRLADRLSPRQAWWVIIGILLVAGIVPLLLSGVAANGLAGVWDAIKLVALMAVLAIFWITMDSPPKRRRTLVRRR